MNYLAIDVGGTFSIFDKCSSYINRQVIHGVTSFLRIFSLL